MSMRRWLGSWMPVRRSRYEEALAVIANRDATLAAVDKASGILMAMILGVQREKEALAAKIAEQAKEIERLEILWGEADKRAEAMDRQLTAYQSQVADIWKRVHVGGIPNKLVDFVCEVEDGLREILVYRQRIKVDFERPAIGSSIPLVHLRTCVSMALGDTTPPEFVADRMAADLRAAILKQWRSQSILEPQPAVRHVDGG